MSVYKHLIQRSKESPYLILPGVFALLNGYWHKLKFFLLGKRVKIGKAFRVYGTFRVLGPGRVVIGDNCMVDSKLHRVSCFSVGFPNAHIEVGNNATFGGTVIQCCEHVVVKEYCCIANAYITDSAAHHLSADRRSLPAESVERKEVVIEENVWVSINVAILHGCRIGKNSVIGANSLVRDDVAQDSFFAGNPAQFIANIPTSIQNTSSKS